MRGVVVVPEVSLPGQTLSWAKGAPKLLASCPTLIEKNPNNGALNPYAPDLENYLSSLITGLKSAFFPPELKITPILHLGGKKPNFECWKEDPSLASMAA